MAVFVPRKTLHLAGDVAPTPPARAGQTLAWDAAAGLYRPGAPFAPVYNVLDNGVTGNGTTDDQPALQALVNKLLPVAYGGTLPPGIIFFPPPPVKYKIGSTLDLTHACALTLLGCGTNHPTNPSYLSWTGASGVGIRGDSSNGLQLRNLRIQADNPACTGDLVSFAYATNDSNGIVIADCFLGGSDAAQPLRSLVSMQGSSGAMIRGNMFNGGQRGLRLGFEVYNIATTVEGSNMFVSQSVYSIDFAHTENLTIRGNIFEGGPDLAQHAIRGRSPLNYGVCIEGNWAGDSLNPPGGVLLDLQDILGLSIIGANRFSSSDTLMKLDAIMGGEIAGNVFDSLGALYLFAGTQSSGLYIDGNYAATAQALYQGPLPTYSYLEGTGYTWDAGAKTVRISGSTTPAVELNDGTNLGNIKFNGGQLEISNNGGGLSISPAGGVGLDLVATQKLGVNGNLGFFGYDWRIGNDVNMGWGFESSSAGGRFLVGVAHAAAAQADPGLHGFRVRDSYLDSTNFLVDGNSAATWFLKSSTTGSRAVGRVVPEWVNSTDASRTGRLRLVAADWTGTDRELIRFESDGTAGRLGFFAATAAIRQAGDVASALSTYGLVTAPSYAAASITGTIAPANLGTGTPGAGKYVDGGTGAWTTLPTGGGSGTVTSVALTVPSWLTVSGSPVTTSGTLAVAATAGQAANQVLATPDGSTGAVSPRALVAADIPQLAQYALLAGRSGGQTIFGDTASGGNLTLKSTSNASLGRVNLNGTTTYIDNANQLNHGGQYLFFSGAVRGTTGKFVLSDAGKFLNVSSDSLIQFDSTTGWSTADTTLSRDAAGYLRVRSETAGGNVGLRLKSKSSTTANQSVGLVEGVWATSTDASRKGRLIGYASDFTGTDREGWRVESDGTQALLSFFGGTAVARPVLSYSRSGAGETAAGAALRQALAALGLVTDSTTA